MRRRPDEEVGERSPLDSAPEEFLGGVLEKYRRFFRYVAIGLGVLIVAALMAARHSGAGH